MISFVRGGGRGHGGSMTVSGGAYLANSSFLFVSVIIYAVRTNHG